jgi:hypothetical protein
VIGAEPGAVAAGAASPPIQPVRSSQGKDQHEAPGQCRGCHAAHADNQSQHEEAGDQDDRPRFEIVMVSRSLDAASAIIAGNSISLMASVTMVQPGYRRARLSSTAKSLTSSILAVRSQAPEI